ncbi:MAG: hypothetical protein ACLKAN_11610, partial [Alkaliphilus sp.]
MTRKFGYFLALAILVLGIAVVLHLEKPREVVNDSILHESEIVIGDNNLAEAIRRKLDIPTRELTKVDLLKLKKLEIIGEEVVSLRGLEHALN